MKLNKSEIALCADIHLGLHQSSTDWHNISIDFGHWLKQTLLDKNIKDIIILGDTIENRNEVSVPTLHFLYKFFKILEDFNIIIVLGNHDCYYSKRSDVHSLGTLSDWSNIEVIDKPMLLSMFNKNLMFCPWNTGVNDISTSDIIFGHFDINTFKMNGGRICENGLETQTLLNKSPLTVSGHFHCTEERKYKNGKIVYVGSPYEQNWGECGDPKGIYILDIDDSNLTFIPNKVSPRHIKLRFSELLAVGKITDNIKKEITGNIVNFIIDVEAEQKIIDTLLTKFYTLKPFSIKTEHLINAQEVLTIDDEMKFEGIDIKQDIASFVDGIESVENKTNIVNYLSDVYDKCKEGKK